MSRALSMDMLGKMDKLIARMTPVINKTNVYHPGHNKFDLDYSIGVLRPDAVIHSLWSTKVDDPMVAKLRAWGYELTPGGWWMQRAQLSKVVEPAFLDFSFKLEPYSFLRKDNKVPPDLAK